MVADGAVRALSLPETDRDVALARARATAGDSALPMPAEEAADIEQQLCAMLAGESAGLGLPLDVRGTLFQRAVWKAMAEIPRGETLSYADIAERVGRPGAARAVGQAVGANPLPLVLPCHRVIAANGTIGGFGGGGAMKRALLAAEGVTV